MKMLLSGLSKIYSKGMSLRGKLYSNSFLNSYKASMPVISIGNISAGGTGKTPLCIFLAGALGGKGYSPVILSRGYGGNYRGVHHVNKKDGVLLTGDEPLLMANTLEYPVILCRDRIKGAKYIEKNNLGNLIILDDALQHIRLKRDIDIVTLNLSSERDLEDFTLNRVIPFGRLREDRDAALSRAHFVVFSSRMPQSKAQPPSRELLKLIPQNVVIVSSYFEGSEAVSLTGNKKLQDGSEVVALCGIANPQGFFTTLEAMGFRIREKVAMPDHHVFSTAELRRIRNKFPEMPIVCTEKDAVRISDGENDWIYKLRGKLQVIPEDAFIVQIEKRLKQA